MKGNENPKKRRGNKRRGRRALYKYSVLIILVDYIYKGELAIVNFHGGEEYPSN